MDGLTASRLKLLGDPTRWKSIAGAFPVTNEWLKLDQRTLSSSGSWTKPSTAPTYPRGFAPRLSLAMERFAFGSSDGALQRPRASIRGRCFARHLGYPIHLDCHPDLSKEAQVAFFIKTEGGINRIPLSEDGKRMG